MALQIGDAVRQGAAILAEAAVPEAKRTAELLLAHALAQPRVYLLAHPEEPLTELAWIHYGRWLHERSQGKPLQYILQQQEFYGRPFRVTPDVLIPRPETELLAERAIALRPARMADIGTGSGILPITLYLECGAASYGIDLSARALAVAQRNAKALGAAVTFVQGDLASAMAPACVDLLTANLPYVPEVDRPTLQREVREWEPSLALFSGPDGLDHYRRFLPQAARVLRPGGTLLAEFGFGQAEAIRHLATAHFAAVELHEDLAGIPRILAARTAG